MSRYPITFWICVLILWITKGYFVVKIWCEMSLLRLSDIQISLNNDTINFVKNFNNNFIILIVSLNIKKVMLQKSYIMHYHIPYIYIFFYHEKVKKETNLCLLNRFPWHQIVGKLGGLFSRYLEGLLSLTSQVSSSSQHNTGHTQTSFKLENLSINLICLGNYVLNAFIYFVDISWENIE